MNGKGKTRMQEMSDLAKYNYLLYLLRETRREPGHTPKDDRGMLARLEDMYLAMSEQDQTTADTLSWLGWPDEFDKRQAEGGLREQGPGT